MPKHPAPPAYLRWSAGGLFLLAALIAPILSDFRIPESRSDVQCCLAGAYDPTVYITRDHSREERIDKEIPADVIDRLSTLPEFVKACEPDGMTSDDFISYGASQRTLCQFVKAGWRLLENTR